jgi:hypothetical protein
MFELNLPLPPSINEYLPSKQGNSHPVVRAFTRQADLHLPEQQSLRKIEPVVGPFEFEVVLDRARRRNGDVDNRATKAFLDWLQRVKLIGNDRDCERIVACWSTHLRAAGSG